ncbi:family 79 glycoside hydrolase [Cryphonectria parasitica EP155]|uniref:Family 79 glycoside hydrolase n=1 Tax=Cryphonectria parasitica (strain ATCC 38755 / EP155) TaxID=660469 RepID=A0A9P4Y1F4_CRYP1|nr:family 79 glycoside hydrolase [Cryphonectria parasitica EP155]KAF3764753.1 family 79 glycoside hydrolase [Cryphonectria parasitica EP155]
MTHMVVSLIAALATGAQLVSAVTFAVPTKTGVSGYAYASLAPAPVGISFEFFTFPSYFTNVTATTQCLANWEALTGTWPPIRIGGTTQDRALYDPTTSAYVVYTVAAATDAPDSLTFGSSFMSLAGKYEGSVVLGLDRGKDNITNTIAAAKVAVSEMGNLLAIELGNEPEYWASDDQPIASGTWTPATDAASQDNWDIEVGSAIGRTDIIQAGNSNSAPPTWGAAELIATENTTVKQYVATYAHHNYPGGTVESLMSHSDIVSNLNQFPADIAAAVSVGKPYVLGETNSVSGGGAATVSPTFGAALWTLDYTVRATYLNITRTYFHQGTIGNCYYCFWGRYDMGAPYYGATAATAFLAGGSHLTALDSGSTDYAGYVTFDASGAPLRVLLYNSDYFDGSGTRGSTSFVLTGLSASSVKAKRLTAANALSRQDEGGNPSWGEQYYANGTCVVGGTETYETTSVSGGQATFTVAASEALVVYLQ